MIPCAFVIPGDIDWPTGGYGYDRRVLARLGEHGVSIRHVELSATYPAPTPEALASTQAAIARLPPSTVLLIDGLAYGAMPADLVRKIVQPIVALCHHPLALETGLPATRQVALQASETAALALARHVIVPSATTRQILIEQFAVKPCRMTVAEPGTDRAARARGTGRPLQLLAVGSIVPRKGYPILIEALAELRQRNWRLTIAGATDRSPETTRALESQIAALDLAPRVDLIGPASESQLQGLYDAADLFVMPSLFEGYGMMLTEAMVRGLPILCTTGGAAAQTVPDGVAVKVPPGDPAAFGAALAELLDDGGQRRRLADAAWSAAAGLPTWDDTALIIAGVIRRVAA